MFRGNPLRVRKNRRYNYTPRYYKGKEEGNPYDFDSKFARYRDTYNTNDFGHQWKEAREKCATEATELFLLYYFHYWFTHPDSLIYCRF